MNPSEKNFRRKLSYLKILQTFCRNWVWQGDVCSLKNISRKRVQRDQFVVLEMNENF